MISVCRAAALAAVAYASILPAGAQTSNSPLGQPQVMSKISASDVASMMTELSITSQMVTPEGSPTPYLLATTAGGGRFLFRFEGCEIPAAAKNCGSSVVTAALPSTGFTLEDVNGFNGRASVTTGVHVPEQRVVILGRHILVIGGHSRELFKGTVYLFLVDVQTFANQMQAANSVAFRLPPEKAAKIAREAASEAAPQSPHIFGAGDMKAEVSMAIANSAGVDFLIERPAGE